MRVFLFIVLLLFLVRLVLATVGVTIRGGPVKIKGGYVDIGTTVVVSTTSVPERAGQCIGILCGVTYN